MPKTIINEDGRYCRSTNCRRYDTPNCTEDCKWHNSTWEEQEKENIDIVDCDKVHCMSRHSTRCAFCPLNKIKEKYQSYLKQELQKRIDTGNDKRAIRELEILEDRICQKQ